MSYKFRQFIIFFIKLYQKTLSFDHGFMSFLFPFGRCRFYPSCSQYTSQAVEEHGVFKGLILGFQRLFRCHPWASGGYDPIKKSK